VCGLTSVFLRVFLKLTFIIFCRLGQGKPHQGGYWMSQRAGSMRPSIISNHAHNAEANQKLRDEFDSRARINKQSITHMPKNFSRPSLLQKNAMMQMMSQPNSPPRCKIPCTISSRDFEALQKLQGAHETRGMSDVTAYPEHCLRFPSTLRDLTDRDSCIVGRLRC
jgi:hypothetical protein